MRKIWNNQYEQLRKIGEGASGRVMLARDLHLNRLVAIKEMEQIREIVEILMYQELMERRGKGRRQQEKTVASCTGLVL